MEITQDHIWFDRKRLPETYDILTSSNLVVDEAIRCVFVSGSRGPSSSYRPDSDIDISLILDAGRLEDPRSNEPRLQRILETTIVSWLGPVELDTVLLFEKQPCELGCFTSRSVRSSCPMKKLDCFGLYKLQKGFSGFVPQMGIDVDKIFPIQIVWAR